jgi:hypothetical protein
MVPIEVFTVGKVWVIVFRIMVSLCSYITRSTVIIGCADLNLKEQKLYSQQLAKIGILKYRNLSHNISYQLESESTRIKSQ